MESVAAEFEGRARLVKIHVDRDRKVLERFDASGLPTYILFEDGVEVDRLGFSWMGWFLERRLRWMIEGALD